MDVDRWMIDVYFVPKGKIEHRALNKASSTTEYTTNNKIMRHNKIKNTYCSIKTRIAHPGK